MTYKRGDIVLVYFPYTDFSKVDKRPALIIQADSLVTDFPNFVVAQITSKLKRATRPQRISVLKNDPMYTHTNLQTDSIIVTDMIMTLNTSLIDKKIGEITDMTPIDTALRLTLGL